MREIIEFCGMLWCRLFHGNISRPVGTYYVCFDCGRRYKTPWAATTEPGVWQR